MFKIALPNENVESGAVKWDAKRIIRDVALMQPFWKVDGDLSKIHACLEIEEQLDKENNAIEITKEAWTYLKDSMKMNITGSIQILDPKLNRLYMKVYRAILTGSE